MRADYENRDRRISPGPGQALQGWIDMIAPCPWTAHTGCATRHHRAQRTQAGAMQHRGAQNRAAHHGASAPLYTPEQRRRRDESPWTMVQGVLAPLQFLVFAISLALVVRYLATGEGYVLATLSVIIKTVLLYTIMVTGSVWEKVVFDHWLFAPAFFWEDMVSMVVLVLHTAYVGAVLFGVGTADQQMMLALAAYASYVINAVQFVWKLRAARLEGAAS